MARTITSADSAARAGPSFFVPSGLLVSIIAVVTILTYSRIAKFGLLQWDDQYHLTSNPFLQLDSPNRYSYFWQHPYGNLYIPITYDLWAWIYPHCFDATGQFSPVLLHCANIFAHCVVSALVFFLIRQLLNFVEPGASRNRILFAALIGTLFFAIHPLQAESVAWISEFRGLLASIFALAAMICYFSGAKTPLDLSIRGSLTTSIIRCGGPSVFLAVAFLCKPSVASVPFILLAIDVFWLGTRIRKAAARLALPFLLTIASLVVNKTLQTGGKANEFPIALRPFIAGDALMFYISRFFWPFALTADHSRTPEFVRTTSTFCFAWIAPAALIAISLWLWRARNQRVLLTATAVFIAALLPVLGLVSFDFQRISTVADRYAYLALLGPAIAIAWISLRPRASLIILPLLALMAWRTNDQTQSWRDGDSLWQHAVDVNPHAVVATGNLANSKAAAGDRAGAERLYHHVIELSPHDAGGYRGLGLLAADGNDSATALQWYQRAMEADPTDAPSYDGAGSMLVALDRPGEAERDFRRSVEIDPNFANGWNNLGALLLQFDRYAEAQSDFDRALAIDPRHAQALLNLAAVETTLGNNAAAEQTLRYAVQILKQNSRPSQLLGQRALAKQNWPEADHWLGLSASIDPGNASVINDLGQALAAGGKVDEGIATFQRALALMPDSAIIKENLENARKLKRLRAPGGSFDAK